MKDVENGVYEASWGPEPLDLKSGILLVACRFSLHFSNLSGLKVRAALKWKTKAKKKANNNRPGQAAREHLAKKAARFQALEEFREKFREMKDGVFLGREVATTREMWAETREPAA